jgi:hypothetical protein
VNSVIVHFHRRHRRPKARIVPRLGVAAEQTGPVSPTPQHRGKTKGKVIMAFALSESQQVTLSVKFKTKKGHDAKVDGVPEWLTDNTEVLALTPAPDGLSCLVAAVGPLGTATVSVKGDADLGVGVKPIVGLLEVEVTAGDAATVTLTPGEPSEQAEAPPTPTP